MIGAPVLCVSAGVFNYAHTPRNKWIADCLGMVTLAGSQVWWTWETEDRFRQVREGDKHAMKAYAAKLTKQLVHLTGMVSDHSLMSAVTWGLWQVWSNIHQALIHLLLVLFCCPRCAGT